MEPGLGPGRACSASGPSVFPILCPCGMEQPRQPSGARVGLCSWRWCTGEQCEGLWPPRALCPSPSSAPGPMQGSEGCRQRWLQGLSGGCPAPTFPSTPDWNKELQKPLSAPGSTQRPGVSAWRCLRGGGHGGLTHHPRLLLSCHPLLSSAPPWPCSPSLQWGQLGVTLRVTPEGQSWDINPEGQSRGSVPTAHPCAPPQAGLSPALPSVHEQQGGTWYPFIYKQIK